MTCLCSEIALTTHTWNTCVCSVASIQRSCLNKRKKNQAICKRLYQYIWIKNWTCHTRICKLIISRDSVSREKIRKNYNGIKRTRQNGVSFLFLLAEIIYFTVKSMLILCFTRYIWHFYPELSYFHTFGSI